MYIKTIEPTPSPNTMKLILSETLAAGKRNNYTKENANEAPEFIEQLFTVEGIKGVYHVADFIALERNAKFDWKVILPKVREIFGEAPVNENEGQVLQNNEQSFGEVRVQLQLFKQIPMQVKVTDGEREVRVGLPERFMAALQKVQSDNDNVVLERKWVEQDVRYGELEEVANTVAEEIEAAYSEDRINQLLNGESSSKQVDKQNLYKKVTLEMLDNPDWKKRYEALDRMNPTEEDLPILLKALEDEKASIRRQATVYLGMLEDTALQYLYKALNDKSVTVRRTAGDCLSDIGNKEAIPAMVEALKDESKLVRWRAAMFLYEVGDEQVLPALKEAKNDSEFEVSMQINMAIERIEKGEEAKGSVWKQMTEAVLKKDSKD
ncbi:conserved virulence factor C family protein [Alkalihalobacterium chitinilyticum]|uniref:Virulence factor n=1 Tax=Alkalihalobacterium chitinilyticum TaxID=2980103 RepID=A0ABT5VCE1_9BACI|nr:virulence factor [Alkalihalobacterium chitinilyticum]MDE5411854.1 virulence factor [Alkalihalobacterium chitinilyticum]